MTLEGSRLNDKQRMFVLEYLKDFNATQAGIRAGYSPDSAYSQAHDLLKKPEIQALIQEHIEIAGANTHRVLGELTKIAFADMGEYATVEEGGGVKLTPFKDLPYGATKAIKKVKNKRTISESPDGSAMNITDQTELEHHDKLKALELLGKHLGMFKENLQVTGSSDDGKLEIRVIKSNANQD